MRTFSKTRDRSIIPNEGGDLLQSSMRRAAEVALILCVFFVAAGDPAPAVNEPHYLSRLKHFWNPAWCANDMFLQSPDTQGVFIWAFGWVTRFLSLAATAWGGRTIVWTLLAFAWQRLSWRVVPFRLAAVLSAALFFALNGNGPLAGEWVVGGVEAKGFAYGFVLLALGELVDERWGRACILLGVATAFHPLVGGWSTVVCGAMWLLSLNKKTQNAKWRFACYVIAGGLLAMVGIWPALKLTWGEPAEVVAEASRIYVFERLPHHLALFRLPPLEIATRLGTYAALLGSLFVLMKLTPEAKFRRISIFAWGAVALSFIGFAIEIVLWNQPLVGAKLQRYYWYRLADFAVPMAVAFGASALIIGGLEHKRRWAGWLLAVSLLYSGWYLGNLVWQRVENPAPPADRKMRDYAAWMEVCDWIAANTPADAVFLTPRLNQTFKWRASRAEVANRKDMPQDARGIIEWNRRMKDIYHATIDGLEQTVDSVGVLGTKRAGELATKYGANYVLSDRGQLLSLPRVFWNEEYVVYRIENRSAGNSR